MQDPIIITLTGLCSVYFGFQCLRILPVCFRVVEALRAGIARWPGPPVYDPDPRVRQVDQWLGRSTQFLFPFFFKHALGVFTAFSLSAIMGLNVFFNWIVPIQGHEWMAFGLPLFAVIVGGCLFLKRALISMYAVKKFLSQ